MRMLAEVNWIFFLPASVFGTICLTISLVLCICGCRTKEPKDELVGMEGRVKITNPEDYAEEVNANNILADLHTDKVQNTAKRSLPDLPVDSQVNGRSDVIWELNGDAISELYATVTLEDERNKKLNNVRSESDSMGPSLTYTKSTMDHPYDKLKKIEHPYAQVKNHQCSKRASSTSHLSNNIMDERGNVDLYDSDLMSANRPGNESTGNIAAATAIAGQVTASDDLPYMTPPAHFSGDSQDSGKGYTSISVREPLSAIRGENKTIQNRRTDPHYAFVSDDSDDMYAAIDDPSQIYTSESETYAQIHTGSEKLKSAPQPPSVDSLKQMTFSSHSHSRQASSSSLASSVVVNSPKPEKRPANSPLPPTPTKNHDSVEDLCAPPDKNAKSSVFPRNIEDMYAKVNKKTRRDLDHLERGGSTESGVSESSDSLSYKLQTSSTTTDSSRSCHSYLSKSTLTDTPSSSSILRDVTDSFGSATEGNAGYEKLAGGSFEFDRKSDPGYETVHKGPPSESDPDYEKLKPQKYSHVILELNRSKTEQLHDSSYANVPNAETSACDGYAQVKTDSRQNEIYFRGDSCESDGYARVEPHEARNNYDGYAKILNHNNNETDPNYEKVSVSKSSQSNNLEQIAEPTYESLGNEFEGDDPNDPNYESVRFLRNSAHAEPPYQLLRECESGAPQN